MCVCAHTQVIMYNFLKFLPGKHSLYLAPRLINSPSSPCSDFQSVTMNPVAPLL